MSASFRLGANKKDTPTYFRSDSTGHVQANKVKNDNDKLYLSTSLNRIEGSYQRNSMEAMENIHKASEELDSTRDRITSSKMSKKPKSAMRISTSMGERMNERGGHSPKRSSYQERSRRRCRVGMSALPKGSGGQSPKHTPAKSERRGRSPRRSSDALAQTGRSLMHAHTVSYRRGDEQGERRKRRSNGSSTKSFEVQQPTFRKQMPEVNQDKMFEVSPGRLRLKKEDRVSLVNNKDDSFRKLQQSLRKRGQSLRKRGVVANVFLEEDVHLYLQHIKTIKARASQSQIRSLRKQRTVR